MGEVTPEMVETYRRMVGQSKCGSGCRFEAPGYLGRLAQIKVMEALLSEWEERGRRIADLKFALGDNAGWFDRAMAAERSLAEARAEAEKWKEEHHFQACLTKELLPYQDRAVDAERDLAEAREKLAKVATLLNIIKQANEPCDAEYGYCVHCACVEALAAAKGE